MDAKVTNYTGWQSDVIVDCIKRYGFPYITLNPGGVTSAVTVASTGVDFSMESSPAGTPGTVQFGSGAKLGLSINGTTVNSTYQQMNVVGKINLTGLTLNISGTYVPVGGDTFTIVSNDAHLRHANSFVDSYGRQPAIVRTRAATSKACSYTAPPSE